MWSMYYEFNVRKLSSGMSNLYQTFPKTHFTLNKYWNFQKMCLLWGWTYVQKMGINTSTFKHVFYIFIIQSHTIMFCQILANMCIPTSTSQRLNVLPHKLYEQCAVIVYIKPIIFVSCTIVHTSIYLILSNEAPSTRLWIHIWLDIIIIITLCIYLHTFNRHSG